MYTSRYGRYENTRYNNMDFKYVFVLIYNFLNFLPQHNYQPVNP